MASVNKKRLYSVYIEDWFSHDCEDYFAEDDDFHEFGFGGWEPWTGTRDEAEKIADRMKKRYPSMNAEVEED